MYNPTKSSNKDYVSWPVFLKGGLIQDTGQTNDELTFNQNSNIMQWLNCADQNTLTIVLDLNAGVKESLNLTQY